MSFKDKLHFWSSRSNAKRILGPLFQDGFIASAKRFRAQKRTSSLLKNLEMESFLVLADRCWGGAVELDVIF